MHCTSALLYVSTKAAPYVPFNWLFQRHVEKGCGSARELVIHPEAPSPASLYVELSRHIHPDRQTTLTILQYAAERKDPNTLTLSEAILQNQRLKRDAAVLNAMCVSLLYVGEFFAATRLVETMENGDLEHSTWHAFLRSIAARKICNTVLLWRLISKENFPSEWSLSMELTASLMNMGGVGYRGQVSALLAYHIMQRYVRSRAEQPHPLPYLVFFSLVTSSKDSSTGTFYLHHQLVWQMFQTLNKSHPTWYKEYPEEATKICKLVVDAMSVGADPWITLNLTRVMSRRNICNGVDIALQLLFRLSPHHHVEESRQVAAKIFAWLIDGIELHMHPETRGHVLPCVRVLIRLGMHSEVTRLHNLVLESSELFPRDFRVSFIDSLQDLACPRCSSILMIKNPAVMRRCHVCLNVITPKALALPASYEVSPDRIAKQIERRKKKSREALSTLREKIVDARRNPLLPFSGVAAKHPALQLGKTMELPRPQTATTSPYASKSALPPPMSGPPKDAAELLKEQIMHEPLVPCVPVRTTRGEKVISLMAHQLDANDIRGALEIPSSAKALRSVIQDEDRDALRKREKQKSRTEIEKDLLPVLHALPTPLPTTYVSPIGRSSSGAEQTENVEWQCVWCQELNPASGSSITCRACEGKTGPAAPWRQFHFASDTDVMTEIRHRIRNCETNSADALVACYFLMMYRRTFLLRASGADGDYDLIHHLVQVLVHLEERVLAAYIYMRILPKGMRKLDRTVKYLGILFGQNEDEIHEADLMNDSIAFVKIFGANTCKVCFGEHDWKRCPIVTRDFATSQPKLQMSEEEREKLQLDRLETAINIAKETPSYLLAAYRRFASLSQREYFAQVRHEAANTLALLLAQSRNYRRAAFVMCHIPLHQRSSSCLEQIAHYFGRTSEETHPLLSRRNVGVEGPLHPNIVQVTLTCCICLDGQHASYQCPKLKTWLSLCLNPSVSVELLDPEIRQVLHGRPVDDVCRMQADGWISSGPERLQAFYKFLLSEEESLERARKDSVSPLYHAVNGCIAKLCAHGMEAHARRLYAYTPSALIARSAAAMILRLSNVSEDLIESAVNEPDVWFRSALETNDICIMCMEHGHSFHRCPELAPHRSSAEKLLTIVQNLGSMKCSDVGVVAAASYVQSRVQQNQCYPEMVGNNKALAIAMNKLALRCFALRHTLLGRHVMRQLPIHLIDETLHLAFWRSAGVPEETARDLAWRLHTLQQQYNVIPQSLLVQANSGSQSALGEEEQASSRNGTKSLTNDNGGDANREELREKSTHELQKEEKGGVRGNENGEGNSAAQNEIGEENSSDFMITGRPTVAQRARMSEYIKYYYNITEGNSFCRHCYQYGHMITECSLLKEEAAFGRDFIATFRITLSLQNTPPVEVRWLLLQIVQFFIRYQTFIPFYLLGVQRGANALCAMMSMIDEPEIALRLVLCIPAAYRMRHVILHLLYAFGIDKQECTSRIENFLITGDPTEEQDNSSHLVNVRRPIPDLLLTEVFYFVPNVREVLEHADELIMAGVAIPDKQCVNNNNKVIPFPQNPSGKRLDIVQCAGLRDLREAFSSMQDWVESKVCFRLGSRHVIFEKEVKTLNPDELEEELQGEGEQEENAQQQQQQQQDENSSRQEDVDELHEEK